MLQSSRSDGASVQLKGIDPALEPEVTDIRGALQSSGSLEALAQPAARTRATASSSAPTSRTRWA